MLQAGLIRQLASGLYHFLPLGLRALEKLVALIDSEMQAIGGAKMAMPILTPAALWKASGYRDKHRASLAHRLPPGFLSLCITTLHHFLRTSLGKQQSIAGRILLLGPLFV